MSSAQAADSLSQFPVLGFLTPSLSLSLSYTSIATPNSQTVELQGHNFKDIPIKK
jgi:hypothetical protein